MNFFGGAHGGAGGNPVADNSMKDLEVETGWIVLVLDHYVTLVMKTKDH